MKRLVFAVAVLMLVAAPALAAVCEKCAKRAYTMDIGKCVECRGHTTSGAHKICPKCSRKLGQCEHCRTPIKVKRAKPRPAIRPKRPMVNTKESGTYTSGKWQYIYAIGRAGSKSDSRHGELIFDGNPIAGMKKFDRINTPWGIMQFFGPRPRRWETAAGC